MSVKFEKNGIILTDNGSVNENILIGTHRSTYSTTVNTANDRNRNMMSGGSGGNGTFSITVADVPVGIYSYNVLNNTSGNRDFQQGGIPYVEGQTYTASWWAKGSGTCLFRSWNRTRGSQVFQHTYALTNEWTFHSYTFTATAAQATDDCTFHLGVTGSSSINICGMKLELGNKPTLWCLNENDDDYIDSSNGFIEAGNLCQLYDGSIQTVEFVEW